MKEVTIYTDGACSGNPGIGGWAAILIYKGTEKILSGSFPNTTNNRMELFAIIYALKALKERCKVNIYSDSAYVIDSINNKWLDKWKSNNWKTASNDDVKNIDLWQDLILYASKHDVTWHKVKGHSDNEYNNRCDKIAREEIKKLSEFSKS
ncbi:MAG TPA: ribonuclease HI [Clostridia bacterium]